MDIINNKLSMLKNSNHKNQQQQHLRGNPSRICTFCKKREPWNAQPSQKLKRCSRCRARLYCSRACQRSDWRNGHQRACAAATNSNASKSKDGNGTETKTETEKKKENSYLESLSEEEAMNQLIDAYRLRVEDERIYRGCLRGRYAPAPQTTNTDTNTDASLQSALRDFQDFLDLAETSISSSISSSSPPASSASPPSSSSSPSSSTASASSPPSSSSSSENKPQSDESEQSQSHDNEQERSSVLPSWWTLQKRTHCECRAQQNKFWSSLCAPVGKDAIVERYQDSMMPMKLRMLAEAVYGHNVMDQPR